jgi:heat shock protein HslJ/uncharacterized lipoprotein NlpE involved in copper resistance
MKQPRHTGRTIAGSEIALALCLSVVVSACSLITGNERDVSEPANPFQNLLLAGSYTGVLPCADCPGIRYTLNLRTGFVYFLRVTYLGDGEGRSFDDLGVWSLSTDRKTLLLRGSRDEPLMFAVKSFQTLRKLDREGREITAPLNYDLTRDETGARFEPHLVLKGQLAHSENGSVFNECITRIQLPIAQEADGANFAAAQQESSNEPEQNFFVKIEGQILTTPLAGATKQQEILLVERFVDLSTEEKCADPPRTAKLEDTDWEFSQRVNAEFDSGGIYLRLRSRGTGMRLFDGCNVIYGGYTLHGQKLRFLINGITKWKCSNAAYEQRRWLETLRAASNWNILGDRLELYDSHSRLLARFEAKVTRP